MQPIKIAVVGAGTWGTVVAALMAGGKEPGQRPASEPAGHHGDEKSALPRRVALVARRPELADQAQRARRNPQYLPTFELPPTVEVTCSLAGALDGASVIVMAVPSRWARLAMASIEEHRAKNAVVLSLAKGIEPGTLLTMSQVGAQVLPNATFAVLSGPNLASEIAAGLPAATVVASHDRQAATALQALLGSPRLRVYTNDDVVGCELAGAVKNVLALAAGMVDGMGAGANARAAMMTRGLAEMTRLGVAMGGHPLTFSGLAGLGDLVLTCSSEQSRNRQAGVALGRGLAPADVGPGAGQVAEGLTSAGPVVELAARYGVEMPICSQVAAVLAGTCTPAAALDALLARGPTHELAGAPAWPAVPGARPGGESVTYGDGPGW